MLNQKNNKNKKYMLGGYKFCGVWIKYVECLEVFGYLIFTWLPQSEIGILVNH